MSELWSLGARALVDAFECGRHTVADAILSLQGRTRAWDKLGAWATARFVEALDDAAELDARSNPAAGRTPLPLHGVPFGVKDVIGTSTVRTGFGVVPPVDFGHVAEAPVVTELRRCGGVLVGKTASCAFAGPDPALTMNPWRAGRTPGGSSAGSGAAVAAGLIPIAVGTQTAGSVLRPAAYCGVAGFKPTYDALPSAGVFPLAPSLDTVGLIARSVGDIALVYTALTGTATPADPPEIPTGNLHRVRLPRLTDYEVSDHLDEVAGALVGEGAHIDEGALPVEVDLLLHAHRVLVCVEVYRIHREMFDRRPKMYGSALTRTIRLGSLVPPDVYARACAVQQELAARMDDALEPGDLFILPTVGAAAPDRSTTGDPRLQIIATLPGMPAITLPTGRDHDSMPIATQLIGRRGDDLGVLRTAMWIEDRLHTVSREFPPVPY